MTSCFAAGQAPGGLAVLIERVLDRTAALEDIDLIENTAQVIADSADCAIGYEAAHMVLKGVRGFREDYEEHILHGRCICGLSHPVPCVSTCPAHVDIPGYVALIHKGRYEDAVRLIRKDNPFVSACAYVCEHPCKGQCRRRMVDDAVNICGLKRFAVDNSASCAAERKFEQALRPPAKRWRLSAADPADSPPPTTCPSWDTTSPSTSSGPSWAACSATASPTTACPLHQHPALRPGES